MKSASFFVTTLLFLSCLGCSKHVSVSGKVTFPDGTPLTRGQVAFSDGDFLGRANLDQNGVYKMGRIKDGDGIPRGTYTVFILGADQIEESPVGGSPKTTPMVASKYTDEMTSGLTCTVEKATVFDFTVEKP